MGLIIFNMVTDMSSFLSQIVSIVNMVKKIIISLMKIIIELLIVQVLPGCIKEEK